MKKLAFFITIIFFSVYLFSCEQSPSYLPFISIDNIELSSEYQGMIVNLVIDEMESGISQDEISTFGIVYTTHQELYPILDLDNCENYLESGDMSFVISNIDEDGYLDVYAMKAYYLYTDENNESQVVYSIEDYVFSMAELASQEDSEYALHIRFIVENEVITQIDLTIDTDEYTTSTDSDAYLGSLTIEDDNIILTVTPEEGYRFVETVLLNIDSVLINASKYTIENQTLVYIFKDPNFIDPLEYVDVDVTFDSDGGYWNSSIFQSFDAENELMLTALNDVSGVSFTLVNSSITTLRWFYKLFIKYNEAFDAFEVVATDRATAAISDLTLPAYDYALAIHDNCLDLVALDAMILYTSDYDGLLLITFDSDVDLYTSGALGISIYTESIISQDHHLVMNEAVELPSPFRQEYTFVGWSDGQRIFSTFPRYQAQDNTLQITYIAVWEADSMSDVELYLSDLIPESASESLDLPLTYSAFTIEWISSDPEIISNLGIYHRPYQLTTVTLTAIITSGTQTLTKYYTIDAEGYKSLSAPIASSYIYRDYHLVTDAFFETLDIINCAFITADAAGTLTGNNFIYNVTNYIMPKARAHGNWVIPSIAPDSQWLTIGASTTIINTFADNIVNLINTYGFDGIDIDWEMPLPNGTQYTVMMQIINAKVKANNPNHLVTAAIAGGTWQPPSYDLTNSHQYLDYINMMTYGMVSNNGYYQNALYRSTTYDYPTFNAGKTLGSCSIAESVAIYNTYGIPNSKIIVGVAFYGIKQTRTYDTASSTWSSWINAGSVSFTYITNNYLPSSLYKAYYDTNAGVPYIVKTDGTQFISYDNPRSIAAKSLYIIDNELGGMMYWENGLDSTGSLLNAMKTGLNK